LSILLHSNHHSKERVIKSNLSFSFIIQGKDIHRAEIGSDLLIGRDKKHEFSHETVHVVHGI
jgi:hypothetical protein